MVQPTNKDYELLSAYLDDALSDSARAALDARLEHDPDLRQALDDLRTTVQILRAAPEVKPPRNFTLDPARYQRRASWWTRGGFLQFAGAAGALASILLIAIAVFAASSAGAPSSAVHNVALLATQVAFTASPVLDQTVRQATSTEMNFAAAQAPGTVTAVPTMTPIPVLSMTPKSTATPVPTTTLAPTTTPTASPTSLPSPTAFPAPPTRTVPAPSSRPGLGAAAPATGPETGQSGSGGATNGLVPAPTQAAAAALSGAPTESPTPAQASDRAQESPSQPTALAPAPLPILPTGTPLAKDTAPPSPAPSARAMKGGTGEGFFSVTASPIPESPTAVPAVATKVAAATTLSSVQATASVTPVQPTATLFLTRTATASATSVSSLQSPPPTIPWLLIGGIALLVFSLMLLGISFLRSRL